MTKLIRLLVLASLAAGLFGFGAISASPAAAAPENASNSLRLVLNAPNGSGILSGYLQGIDPSIAFVTLTVTLRDGSNRTVNVDSSTGWQFSFGVLPPDGYVSLALTENPIPMPQMIGNDWDYGYLHGYFYGYPYANQPWNAFTGYSYPTGYGWGNYPFGYYAYAKQLHTNYGLPYFWNYSPVYNTPRYTYYGVAGLPSTYYAPQYGYTDFGTITQPYYLNNYSLNNYNPLFTLPNPVLVPNAYVAPYLGQAQYSSVTYTAPAIQTQTQVQVQAPNPMLTQTPVQNVAGTNLYQGNGSTSSVQTVNLQNYALPAPTTQTTNQTVPGTNLYQGKSVGSGVAAVNLPAYAVPPTQTTSNVQPATNLYQGANSGQAGNASVQNVNLPQYAPKVMQITTPPAPVQVQPPVQTKIAPQIQQTQSTGQGQPPGINLWQGSNAGGKPQPHQIGSVMR